MTATLDQVAQFLAAVPMQWREVVQALRRLVLDTVPDTEETVLWRGLSYHRPEVGGRIKGAVCQIAAKSDWVELGFVHGALLPDPAGLLVGSAKFKRVVRVTDLDASLEDQLRELVRAALTTRWDEVAVEPGA